MQTYSVHIVLYRHPYQKQSWHEILRKAGWSNAGTFSKFYEKDIIMDKDEFTSAVLHKKNIKKKQ